MNTNQLEIFSEWIRRETVRQGGWGNNDWKVIILVALIFGIPGDVTPTGLRRKCGEVEMYCFAL